MFILQVPAKQTTILNDITTLSYRLRTITYGDSRFLGPVSVILLIRPSEIPARYSHRQTPWIVGQTENLFGQILTRIESVQHDPVGRLRVDQPELVKHKDYEGMGYMYLAGPKKAWVSEVRPGKACVSVTRVSMDASIRTPLDEMVLGFIGSVIHRVPAAVFRQDRLNTEICTLDSSFIMYIPSIFKSAQVSISITKRSAVIRLEQGRSETSNRHKYSSPNPSRPLYCL